MRSIEQGQVEDRARRKLALPRLEIDDDVAERIERLGAEERALELLERLPPDQADAVRARVLEQRSYKDIAASVRVSEAVVRKRVSRGLLTPARPGEGTLMSTLPALEAALDEAAHRHYGRAPPPAAPGARVLVPALAIAGARWRCCARPAATAPTRPAQPPRRRPSRAATLGALARAHAGAPTPAPSASATR